ncbi:MAG: hypothetical protein AMJ54_05145 [Deltaproteobacteria bacterium SG8_13]|nr:MAG: hypothetical protein AMJ54_05145 [Deltaproteobacteria bacterium SG8_13]
MQPTAVASKPDAGGYASRLPVSAALVTLVIAGRPYPLAFHLLPSAQRYIDCRGVAGRTPPAAISAKFLS